MNQASNIRERMMVHARGEGSMGGSSGVHIGTVDHIEGDMIKLTRNDSPDGQHHYIPVAWVERIEGNTVHLSRDADSVHHDWHDNAHDNASASMGRGNR